jgi:beta-xylosidase
MVWSGKKPIAGVAAVVPQASDDFNEKSLPAQWEWNYQPRAEMWSLTEKPGYLRLKAFKPLKVDDLKEAGNTLTQRAMRTDANEVTIKMDIGGMADGQEAGLCHFAKTNSTIGVSQAGKTRTLKFSENGKATAGPVVTADTIWLRSTWGFDGLSAYAYSVDGKTFTAFGGKYQLTWGNYRGDRIGIFCYNNKSEAGMVDVDSFTYAFAKPAGVKGP